MTTVRPARRDLLWIRYVCRTIGCCSRLSRFGGRLCDWYGPVERWHL